MGFIFIQLLLSILSIKLVLDTVQSRVSVWIVKGGVSSLLSFLDLFDKEKFTICISLCIIKGAGDMCLVFSLICLTRR